MFLHYFVNIVVQLEGILRHSNYTIFTHMYLEETYDDVLWIFEQSGIAFY